MDKVTSERIAKCILQLNNKSSYIKIESGFFKKAPSLTGYYVNLSSIADFPLYIILNTSKDFESKEDIKNINDTIFIILSPESIKKDLISLFAKAFKEGEITVIDPTKHGLPYGYYKDEDGKIVVDEQEARQVLMIFRLYNKLKSMRKVVEIMQNSRQTSREGELYELGVIAGILHDDRYTKMKPIIVPTSIFRQTDIIIKRSKDGDARSSETYRELYR